MDVEDIMKLKLNWSNPVEVITKNNVRSMVRNAKPINGFWDLWRTQKEELKKIGISCTKKNDEWLVSWWSQVTTDKEEIIKSHAKDSDIKLVVPDGLKYMPFQKAGIEYSMSRKGVLLADEPGLGKTIQVLGLINQYPNTSNVIVVCPKSVLLNWKNEANKWLIKPFDIIVVDKKTIIPKSSESSLYIINYEQLGNHIDNINKILWDFVVLDEAHYIKSKKAIRSRNAKSIKGRKVLRLTGTPLLNRPAEIYNLIDDLDGINFSSFFRFAQRYCDANQTRFGWDFSGASNLGELQEILREKVMVRRLKSEVLIDLPEKTRTIIELQASEKDIKALVKKEKEIAEQLQNELNIAKEELAAMKDKDGYTEAVEKYRKAAGITFTEIARMRYETAMAKTPYALDYVKELLESTNKIFLVAHHKDVINQLYNGLIDYNPVLLTGDTSTQDRQNAIDKFQNDVKCRVFIGSITAAGIGITLTAANFVVFVEFDWRPGILTQCEDRCHRVGQKDSVFIQHLVFDGSIDINMLKTIIKKQEVIDKTLDDDNEPMNESMYDEYIPTELAKPPKVVSQVVSHLSEYDVLHKLRIIASYDTDRASAKNGRGFNKLDSTIGHSLSTKTFLTPRQLEVGRRLVNKYKKQLEEQKED